MIMPTMPTTIAVAALTTTMILHQLCPLTALLQVEQQRQAELVKLGRVVETKRNELAGGMMLVVVAVVVVIIGVVVAVAVFVVVALMFI